MSKGGKKALPLYNNRSMRWTVALLALLASLTAGCEFAGSKTPLPKVWAAGDMLQLTDRSVPAADGVWRPEESAVGLFAATNETVAFQLVIDAPPRGAAGVKVHVGPLTAASGDTLPSESIRLFAMRAIPVELFPAWYLRLTDGPTQPAGFYDILTPLAAGAATDLAGSQRLAVWVDLFVPPGVRPGEYAGPVTVTSMAGATTLKLVLRVYDFVLPDVPPVTCLGGFSHETIFRQLFPPPAGQRQEKVAPDRLRASNKDVAAALAVIRQLMRLAHEHKLDLFDRDLHPALKRDESGQVVLAWDDYDAIVKPYLEGTAFDDWLGVAAWPAPVHAGWPDSRSYGGPENQTYRETLASAFAQSARHFAALGFADRLFAWGRTDTDGPEASQRYADLARLLRSADGKVPLLTELPPGSPPATAPTAFGSEAQARRAESRPDFGELSRAAALADLYAPRGDLLDLSAAPALARPDNKLAGLWLRPGPPPFLGGLDLLSPPADIRGLPWVALKYGCAGIFIPEVLDWQGGDSQFAAGGDKRLFYPSPNGREVLPSVRLKRLRRGLQDAAYLWLLRRQRQPAAAEAMLGTLVHYAGTQAAGEHALDARLDGWARDGAAWLLARRVLADQVLAATHPEAVGPRSIQAEKLAQARLNELAAQVRVERVRGRIDPVDPAEGLRRTQSSRGRVTSSGPAGGQYRLTLTLDLFNESPEPADAQVRVLSLPKPWQSLDGGLKQVRLAGGQGVPVEFTAQGPDVPTTPEGKLLAPVGITVGQGQRQEFTVKVPFATAAAVKEPITIDGDLADWPVQAGNCCGEFVLLGRRNRLGAGLAARQTLVFILRDAAHLYLAFRCEQRPGDRLVAQASNLVRYEQLLAAGEDLVEVVLDPGRSAKGVADLYHVLVKANGVVIAQRGIPGQPGGPGLGKCVPWPAAIRAAVGRQDKAWVVELAIPLEALDPAAGQAFWGANFARFSTADNEASSWAGSPRTFYDPGGLGTICVGEPGAMAAPKD